MPAGARRTGEDEEATFTFKGTVKEGRSATIKDLPLDDRTFVVTVDHIIEAPPVGRDFYGIFSANNTPNQANFPNGVVYQRNADFTNHRLLALDNTTPVHPSIDPFFFKVTG